MRRGEFVPASTYFEEREAKLSGRIAAAHARADAAKKEFESLSTDAVRRRDEILRAVTRLQADRDALRAVEGEARRFARESAERAAECATLAEDLADLLADREESVGALGAEIAQLEERRDCQMGKAGKSLPSLEARLAHLRVRRTLAERRSQLAAEAPLPSAETSGAGVDSGR